MVIKNMKNEEELIQKRGYKREKRYRQYLERIHMVNKKKGSKK